MLDAHRKRTRWRTRSIAGADQRLREMSFMEISEMGPLGPIPVQVVSPFSVCSLLWWVIRSQPIFRRSTISTARPKACRQSQDSRPARNFKSRFQKQEEALMAYPQHRLALQESGQQLAQRSRPSDRLHKARPGECRQDKGHGTGVSGCTRAAQVLQQ